MHDQALHLAATSAMPITVIYLQWACHSSAQNELFVISLNLIRYKLH